MDELEFHGFAVQPGSGLIECLDAAGIDGSLHPRGSAADAMQEPAPVR